MFEILEMQSAHRVCSQKTFQRSAPKYHRQLDCRCKERKGLSCRHTISPFDSYDNVQIDFGA